MSTLNTPNTNGNHIKSTHTTPSISNHKSTHSSATKSHRTPKTQLSTTYHTYTPAEVQQLNEPIQYPIFDVKWFTDSTVYISGGGGRAGTGIESGITICNVLIGTSVTAPTYTEYNKTYSMDTVNVDNIGVLPVAFVNTGAENLVFHTTQCTVNPNELIIACSNTMCILDIQYEYIVKNTVQTEYNVNSDGDLNCNMLNVFSHDCKYIVTGGEDCTIQLYNYSTLKLIANTIQGIHRNTISSLSFDRTNTLLCSTGTDTNLHIYKVQSNNELKPLYTLQYEQKQKLCIYRSALFIDNNKTTSSDLLCIVNASVRGPSYLLKYRPCNTGEFILVKQIQISKSPAMQLCINAQHTYAAIATGDGSVYIYDIHKFKCITKRLNIHELPITGLTFSPDSKLLLSAAADKTIQFTKTQSVKLSHTLCYSILPTILIALFITLLITLLFELQASILQHHSLKPYITQHKPIQTWYHNAQYTVTHLGEELPHIKANVTYYYELISAYILHIVALLQYYTVIVQSCITPYTQHIQEYIRQQFHLLITNEHTVLRAIEHHFHTLFTQFDQTPVYKTLKEQYTQVVKNKLM